MSLELHALYEIHRHQILLNAVDNGGKQRFPGAYLYALESRMYPYFHLCWCGGDDPYSKVYQTDKAYVTQVIEYLDELFIAGKEIPSFYELERLFGDRERRPDLVRIVRYCFLDGAFEPRVYDAILATGDHPSEAGSIRRPYDPEEILFV